MRIFLRSSSIQRSGLSWRFTTYDNAFLIYNRPRDDSGGIPIARQDGIRLAFSRDKCHFIPTTGGYRLSSNRGAAGSRPASDCK